MGVIPHSGQKTSCRIIDQVETCKGELTDSIIKCVTVIQPRHDEGIDWCQSDVVQKVAFPLLAAQDKKVRFKSCADLSV